MLSMNSARDRQEDKATSNPKRCHDQNYTASGGSPTIPSRVSRRVLRDARRAREISPESSMGNTSNAALPDTAAV
jgi:hypothetical protein